jgi:hypothetical protein
MEVCKRTDEPTFAGMGGKEEDAPIPDLRGVAIEPLESTLSRRSWLRPADDRVRRKPTFGKVRRRWAAACAEAYQVTPRGRPTGRPPISLAIPGSPTSAATGAC